jgi:hypothetical protein
MRASTYVALACLVLGLAVGLIARRAHGADIYALPNEIKHGRSMPDGDISTFGTYSPAYYRSRWSRMCKGPQRYDAMREAYDMQRPDPCNGAKVWVR